MLEKLTSADFSAYVHQLFRITLESDEQGIIYGPVEAELVEVNELQSFQADLSKRPPFSVIFRCPTGTNMPQHIYTVEHDTLGKLMLFLVPVGPDQKGLLYEAIFT